MNRLFVGRHGRVDDEGNLIAEGHSDGHAMAATLRGFGISRHTILVSSIAPRAVQTTGIIKVDLEIPTVVRSPFITRVGNHPEPVKDLWGFTGDILEACGLDHAKADVVMVTHLPLVKAVTNGTQQDGGIYEVQEAWENPAYRPEFEVLLSRPDRW